MNSVALIGRLARDPELRYTQEGLAIASLSIAIDRGKDRNGNDKGTDFPRVQAFGKTAENCGKYLKKGLLVGVTGKIQTGSYTNKNGDKVYTTDVVADRVEFLERAQQAQQNAGHSQQPQTYSGGYGQPGQGAQMNPQYAPAQQPQAGWGAIDDDNIPF